MLCQWLLLGIAFICVELWSGCPIFPSLSSCLFRLLSSLPVPPQTRICIFDYSISHRIKWWADSSKGWLLERRHGNPMQDCSIAKLPFNQDLHNFDSDPKLYGSPPAPWYKKWENRFEAGNQRRPAPRFQRPGINRNRSECRNYLQGKARGKSR